jgi:hypothetical protein
LAEKGWTLLGKVIELCRTCGFDIPADADRCPGCVPEAGPSLAARQAAGLALPTRSVHALPRVAPRHEPIERPLGKAQAARSAFSFTTTLVLVTLSAAGLAWLASQPQFVLQVPDGTVNRLDTVTTFSALASVAALLVGLVAMAVWCVRAAALTMRRRLIRRFG